MTKIRIDHDIPFCNYDAQYLLGNVERLPYDVESVYIRKSCGGNTHACIKINGKLSRWEIMMIRATLRDDARRIRGDLERCLFRSPAFDLLFDVKIDTEGTISRAGKWVKIK